jgi:uncharacterized protein DUF6328
VAGRTPEDLDRELIELLNELRVALPGVQVLFAFLLAVPFSQRFERVTEFQKDMYFVTLLTTAASTILLIAPSAYHRLRWRQHDKERLLRVSNGLAIAGTLFLAAAMTCAVLLITDVLFDRTSAVFAAVLTALGFAVFWYGLAGVAWLRDLRS